MQKITRALQQFLQRIWKSFKNTIQKRPFTAFVVFLVLLLGVIALGNRLRQPAPPAPPQELPAKQVQTYQVTIDPEIQLQAKIEKSGVIQIVAQTNGVIQKIQVKEGEHVKRTSQLFSMSTNYQGSSVPDVTLQSDARNLQFLQDTYQTQKDIITNNRQSANDAATQASKLRDIARQSIDETNQLINLDNDIVSRLDSQISALQSIDPNDPNIEFLESQKAQTLSGLNAAKNAVRQTQYSSDENNEPAQIANITKDVTLKQLDVQEKMLDMNMDLAKLRVRTDQIMASLMRPVSPCPGTVERVYVKVGQNVAPGTPLASIRGDSDTATAVVLISHDMAQQMSRFQPAHLTIGQKSVAVYPRSISQEPTDGNLLSALYTIPNEYAAEFANNNFVTMSVPIGVNYAHTTHPYIPLDAVYQTSDHASVFLAVQENGKWVAKSQAVTVGVVYGQFIEVTDGLKAGDLVILNRNVIDHDVVEIK